MARIEWVEQRLQNWARWKLIGGSISMARSDPDQAGMPRDPYADKPIPITDCEASDTDDAVGKLWPSALRVTVVEFYLGRGGMRDKARRLVCSEGEIYRRIGQAHAKIAEHFNSRDDRAREERTRVERLQRTANHLPIGF